MKTFTSAPQSQSHAMSSSGGTQASASGVLQAYKDRIVQRQVIDEDELLQGKFEEPVQRVALDEEDLL